MKRIKTLLLVWLSLLFLVSCGNNKLSFDQKMLSGLFQEKDGSFLPGDVKWDDSKEEVMDSFGLSEKSMKENNENEVVFENPVNDVNTVGDSYLNTGFVNDQLVSIELGFTQADEDVIRTVIEWGKNNFSDPEIMGEDIWNDDTETIVKTISGMDDQTHISFTWNGTDESYFSISFLKQGNIIIQIRMVRSPL